MTAENAAAKITKFPKTSPQDGDAAPAPVAEAPARPPVEAPAAPAKPVAKAPSRRRLVLPIIGLVVVAAAGWFGYNYWTVGRFMISTDDAYIGGDIASISPKVSGYVQSVDVTANQMVKAGQPLVTLDNGDYRIAAEQADAQIATQNLTLKRIDAQIEGGRAGVTQARAQKTALQATVRNAQLAKDRASQLQASTFGTQATLDSATAALDQANANLAGADAGIAAAQANIAVLQGQRDEAASGLRSLQLAKDKAQRDLGFTVLRAPYDGVIGNLAVQKGNLVSPGQNLASLVPVGQLYIDANFKETQIGSLAIGEKVNIHVDALDADTITGSIQSISPASGSVFSLLPAENATGNFTKVVQRVPVRIALPQEALASGKLRAGLSVVVDADSRTIAAN
ncbi:MAG: secretion protein HlyD family protein [Hyphomicrobiales bacterium]|nr:secretion protein HlyD family protein [Hyphomicrobiales bacterium]